MHDDEYAPRGHGCRALGGWPEALRDLVTRVLGFEAAGVASPPVTADGAVRFLLDFFDTDYGR